MQRLALSLFYTCTLAFTAMACGGARHIPDDPNTLEQSPPEQSGAGDTPTGSEVPQTDSNESEGSTSTGDAGSTDTQSGSGDSSGNTGDSNGACDRTGFAEATQSRAQATSGGWLFEASNDDLSEFVNISSFVSWDGPTVPGVYELNGINYKDCGLCLLAGTNCVDGSCEKLFYASEGTVEVTSTGTEDGVTVAGVLKNVVFQEVTIAEDYTSTRVAGGSTWCFDEYSFSEVAVDPNAPEVVEGFGGTVDSCVSGGNGTGIGNNIDNLRLQNCNGDLVSLHDQCGVSAAVWFVSTAGWCTACDFWIPRVEALRTVEASSGLEVYYVLGEDASGGVPTSEYCTTYAQDKGVDPSRVLIDNGADGAWAGFMQSINNYGAGYIPWNAVLRGSNMEYLWADNVNDGTITDLQQALDSALGKEVDLTPMVQE